MPIYERDYYICDPTIEDEKQYFDKENTILQKIDNIAQLNKDTLSKLDKLDYEQIRKKEIDESIIVNQYNLFLFTGLISF